MKPMVDMELDDEALADMACPIEIQMPDRARYPYGLKICLTDKELEKLGCDPADACVDGMVHIHAMCRITDVSITEGQMGKSARVELQIESMRVEGEDQENEEAEQEMRRNPLHDNARSR